MSTQLRFGLCIEPSDAFWVQIRETLMQRCKEAAVEMVPIHSDGHPINPSPDEQQSIIEEIIAQELDVLIGWIFPEQLAQPLLDSGLPIIHLSETGIEHPLTASPLGLGAVAKELAEYLAERLNFEGHVVAIGGLMQRGFPDDGRTRLAGIQEAFRQYPTLQLTHIPTVWDQRASAQITTALEHERRTIDAVFGLSDYLALLGREIVLKQCSCENDLPVVGINGDPLALAAIVQGNMMATVETPPDDLAHQAFDIALCIAEGKTFPPHFDYKPRMITSQNVAQVAAEKLVRIASIPDVLVGFKRQEQEEHLAYLETSLKISRQIGSILDDQRLPAELAKLISTNYGYDSVQLFYWSEREQVLTRVNMDSPEQKQSISLLQAGVLGEALTRDELIFIPDLQHSLRFAPDPAWANTRSRVILPIRLGGKLIGLLDLHAQRIMHCTRQHLLGLQSLADQLGVAIQNAKLYQEALHAQSRAEKAEQLKTRFMVNISHELRSPLNIIAGYAESLLESDPERNELQHIIHNARHLARLVNDLLDLSRAEIGELHIAPEMIEPGRFLSEVFHSLAEQPDNDPAVKWRLELPSQLPMLRADPDRLRQIVLNLLSNARKFTHDGAITFGAEVVTGCLHLWVEDTGNGISAQQQEEIFEPFVTLNESSKRKDGVGLGLSITRRLVSLHGGSLTVDSQLGKGSVFHVYLPLPNLKGAPALNFLPGERYAEWPETQPFLMLISDKPGISEEVVHFSEWQKLRVHRLRTVDDLDLAVRQGLPSAIAWDFDQSTDSDWQILQHLYSHPALCEVPFLLFGRTAPEEPTTSMTNIMLKPVKSKTLLSLINEIYVDDTTGSILIVDDDPDARAYLEDIVSRQLQTYRTQTAPSGREALAIMEQQVPCLVILDLMMPHMDGFEVVRWMRTNQRTQRVPVFILSGKVLTLDDIKRLESYKRVSFQTKSVLADDELGQSLQRVLFDNQPLPIQTSATVKRSVAYIHQNYANSISRAEIARAMGVSENYLTQIFHQELGLPLWEYITRYRVTQAKELLSQTDHSVAYIASQVGFDDPAYFSRVFRRYVGQSPRAYRVS